VSPGTSQLTQRAHHPLNAGTHLLYSVRYSRLSRVRRLLGHDGSNQWPDGDKIAVDENYMVVDLITNWVADGLVLCFLHAQVDLSPEDNNQQQPTDWSNWCGTPYMPPEEVSMLYQRLLMCFPEPNPPDFPTTTIFQLLASNPEPSLLISWPPDLPPHIAPLPLGSEFASLVQHAGIGNSSEPQDATTNCTRRYRSKRCLHHTNSSSLIDVESIFIPHGMFVSPY
jgi:hypothetical protein